MPLSSEQLRNATTIYNVGKSMGLGTRDIQIALITAMVESNLINVQYGDRDSLGLFQQRPSQGWGTPAQVTDPVYAAKKFYSTMLDMFGSRRFSMSMNDVAAGVQRPAAEYRDRYGQRIGEMQGFWPSVANTAGDQQLTMDGDPYLTPDLPPVDQVPAMYTPDEMVQAPIPDAATMLGPWGMNAPQPMEPMDPMMDGSSSLLSEGTNSIITQIAESSGGYQQGVDGWRKAVIEAARSALGTPYAWGGNSLQGGVDCSGLIQQAFARAGIDLPRVSYAQANSGSRVGLKGLQPGDLVAWDNSSRNNGADHIAIYIGNGMIIESPRPGLSVRIRSLGSNEGAWGVHMNF